MNLYQRDYTSPQNDAEKRAIELYREFHSRKGFRTGSDGPEWTYPDQEVRRFLWHFKSAFPNNHLYHVELKQLDLATEAQQLEHILGGASNETDVQSYIKGNKKWFIPASLYKEYNFGNHEAYLFPELSLGKEYTVDYALLGKNSDGYSLLLVEFEAPNEPFMIKTSNTESVAVRKGLTQIRDWKRWVDSNRDYLLRSLGFRDKGIEIPSYRFYYCLVVSRRKFMDKIASDLRSQMMYEGNNLKIVSFDRLVDNVRALGGGGY